MYNVKYNGTIYEVLAILQISNRLITRVFYSEVPIDIKSIRLKHDNPLSSKIILFKNNALYSGLYKSGHYKTNEISHWFIHYAANHQQSCTDVVNSIRDSLS